MFLRTGTSWAQEAELIASDAAGFSNFGYSVSLSADGSRGLIGAFGRNGHTGAAYVFVRTGTSWAQEAEVLASDAASNNSFGISVSLSADGSRALVGAFFRSANTGAAYVFLRTGTNWVQEAELLASDAATNNDFGYSVSLSADGSRALVGAPGRSGFAGAAYVFLRTGTSWAQEAQLLASDGARNDELGWSVSLSADGGRALVGAYQRTAGAGAAYVFVLTGMSWAQDVLLVPSPATGQFGTSVTLTADASRALVGSMYGPAYVFTLGPADPNGTACATASTCLSGHCVEGVCCDTACSGGYTPTGTSCSSCLAGNTGGATGTCGPLSAALAPTVTCRPAASACDVAEVCSHASVACDGDFVMPAGTVCHAPPTCAAQCDGTSPACPTTPVSLGTECRASAGACDVAEACDGTSGACPADARLPSGSVCRSVMGGCDQPEVCDGSSPGCPTDSFLNAAIICRPSLGPCDVAESCSGTAAMCPMDRYLAAGSVCAPSSGAVCDAPDVCDGVSAPCQPTFATGVVCRAAAGACDAAESCSGTAATCPPDGVLAAGAVCRASTDLSCDPLESCDGASTSCPADVNTCRSMPDTGVRDAGHDTGARDSAANDTASGGADSSTLPPPISASCGCRVMRARDANLAPILLATLLLLLRRRRAR